MNGAVETTFPVWGLLPKKETEVTDFLHKYPTYDGRGTIIAILDSGVDPGAPGLQTTSEGKVKVLERFDCSGCGDVNTTTIVQPVDGCVTGLTGRTLKIPKEWVNPTNNYRLGIKNAFDLYPKRLKDRIQEERKTKLWDVKHKLCAAEVNRLSAKFEETIAGRTNLTEEERMRKEDIDAKVEHLTAAEKKFTDLGPVYDCVLFHDGVKWIACVDTSEQGDLVNAPTLPEYSVTHQYAPLTAEDQLNFTVNVHDGGNILELVGLCSSHGTHVACIASAYFAEGAEQNGVAPGAQIISLTIGDGRLGSMETGTALVRAMIQVMKLSKTIPIRIINMSYGEHAHWSNAGRIGDLMNEVVNKYGIIWVASAGNHGPALSTIGTPPDISQDTIIGVGAYVSPDMMIAEYSLREKLSGMPYTWSSRGPTIDGGLGVTICAPGGAITSVPNFTLRNSQLMNGTSMAAPHVAGSLALLVSGLRAQHLAYSPYSVKRAIATCALHLPGVESFAQGAGLLQVDRTFAHLTKYCDVQERDVHFRIACGNNNNKGIYIRMKDMRNTYDYSVTVEPYFQEIEERNDTIKAQLEFNIRLVLVCKEAYVSCPTHLDLSNIARSFSIKLDVATLGEGAHQTTIDAFDVLDIGKGPIFRIPITIVKPIQKLDFNRTIHFDGVPFRPNTIKRHFFAVPENGTWAVLRIKCAEREQTGRFILHSMHILPKQSCKSLEMNRTLNVNANVETVQPFQIRGGNVLEIVIAKYWANLGETIVNYSISFHGIKPNYPNVMMHAAEGIFALEVTTLQGEEILPNISFKNSVQVLRPSDSKINPLSERDVIPKGRQIYELLHNYVFHLNKSADVSPNCALLSDVLYESEFESQLWMLFDANKQLMACGDAYPSKYSIKLEKGDYTIKLQIRHEKKDYLEKLLDTPMLITQKLSAPLLLDVHGSHSQAVIGVKRSTFGQTLTSLTVPLYIAPLAAEKFPTKINNPANYLTGSMSFAKDEPIRKVDNYNIKYVLHENSKKVPTKPIDKDKSKMEEYNETVRDLKISFLSKVDATASEQLYEELSAQFPDYYPIYTTYLLTINVLEPKRLLPIFGKHTLTAQNLSDIKKVVTVCDKVLEGINVDSLLVSIAIKCDQRTDAGKIKSTMDRQRNALIDCLCHKGISLCRIYHYTHLAKEEELPEDAPKVELEDICALWTQLLKFVDPSDTKTISPTVVLYFTIWHAVVNTQPGRCLKYLVRLQEEKFSSDIDEKIVELYNILNWPHMVHFLKSNMISKYPADYRPF